MEQPENPILENSKLSITWDFVLPVGAFTTSPIEILYIEANEPQLSYVRT